MSSNPTETGGRPLSPDTPPQELSSHASILPRKRTTSQSSDERLRGTKSTSSRRRSDSKKVASSPHAGSSRGSGPAMQRSTSPAQTSLDVSNVHYTRTGRVSKAKKGLKVHDCECGKSYTRAEHLRRHQKNHAAPLTCGLPGCGKTFHRADLLQRHQERHNEIDKDSRRASYDSEGSVPEDEAPVSASAAVPTPVVTTLQTTIYYPQVVSPPPEVTTPPSQIRQRSLDAHHASMLVSVPVDGSKTSVVWHEPFSPSHNYSSSSEYASPNLSTDRTSGWGNSPYGLSRTRTSSIASFTESWGYPVPSPTSPASTMGYTWLSDEKMASPNFAYMDEATYPPPNMPIPAAIEAVPAYGFGPKSMAERDEEEKTFLFPEQSFGMRHTTDDLSFEQYLDNYWRLFHPSFPVLHRPTFERLSVSPMLLAAMISIGAQFSNESFARRRSRILHDRCLKLLNMRDLDCNVAPDRLCDYQALFLVEVLLQYRARQAATHLSARFQTLYQRLLHNDASTTSQMHDLTAKMIPETTTYEFWTRWIELAAQQRLLDACYILECEQTMYLARTKRACALPYSGHCLPFPIHSSVWEAGTPLDWLVAFQQSGPYPTLVSEVFPESAMGPFDIFQSLLLIGVHYRQLDRHGVYLSPPTTPAIGHLLHSSPLVQHAYLSAMLTQVAPIRALLAVSDDTWIFKEKVPTQAEFHAYKSTLRAWLNGLWSPSSEMEGCPVKEAVKVSIELLCQAIRAKQIQYSYGAELGIYSAALVIWAVTGALTTRNNLASGPPQSLTPGFPVATNLSHDDFSSIPTAGIEAQDLQSATHSSLALSVALSQCNNIYADFTATSITFLENALLQLELTSLDSSWPCNVAFWQQGCMALLLWVKHFLRNEQNNIPDSKDNTPCKSGFTSHGASGLGQLMDGVVRVLEKLLGQGWDRWGI